MSPKSLLFSAGPGLVAGTIAALTMGYFTASTNSKGGPEDRSSAPILLDRNSERSDLRALEGRLRVLNNRTQTLEEQAREQATRANEPPSGRPSETREAMTEVDQESMYQEVVAEWRSHLNAFAQEPLDNAWALKTGATLTEDMKSLDTRTKFEVLSAECRTTTCAVRVRYSSHSEAVDGYGELLRLGSSENCDRSTTLPRPDGEDEGRPYEVTILHDCTQRRADG